MSKFKIKMKLTGFELEIEGSREDIPGIQQALSRQLGGMLQPDAAMLGNVDDAVEVPQMKDITPPIQETKKRKKRVANGSAAKPSGDSAEEQLTPLTWPRDVGPYGVPNQTWSTAVKSVWVLYVAKESASVNELSTKRICDTFNLHYRQAGAIKVANVNRDLGNLKLKSPPWIAEDPTQSPSVWYLTEQGIKEAQQRIAAANQAK